MIPSFTIDWRFIERTRSGFDRSAVTLTCPFCGVRLERTMDYGPVAPTDVIRRDVGDLLGDLAHHLQSACPRR